MRAFAPIGASTADPQILLDYTPLDSSDYEITNNAANYFIYCHTTLSEHDALLLFAVPEYTIGQPSNFRCILYRLCNLQETQQQQQHPKL